MKSFIRYAVLLLWFPLFAVAQTTKVGGSGTTKVGGSGTTKVSAIAGSSFTYNATKFTVDDYMNRAALSGVVDGKSGIVSFWIKFNGGNGTDQKVYIHAASELFKIHRQSDNTWRFVGYTPASSVTLEMLSSTTTTADATWHHILAAWDLATGANKLYIDGTDRTTAVTANNNSIDYTDSIVQLGYDDGVTSMQASISEFYLAFNQFLDITNSTNRLKFRTAGAKPEDLGATGSTPTGTQPSIYLKNVFSSFGTNSGSGGNFTVTGTLETDTAP